MHGAARRSSREIEAEPGVTAVVLRSGKPDNFIAGADIKDFTAIRSALEGETLSRSGQAILDRLAALRVPVVAAIHGACLGGGLETALACRYRIATDDPKTALGLPEVHARPHPRRRAARSGCRGSSASRAALDLILTGRTPQGRAGAEGRPRGRGGARRRSCSRPRGGRPLALAEGRPVPTRPRDLARGAAAAAAHLPQGARVRAREDGRPLPGAAARPSTWWRRARPRRSPRA